MSVFTIADLHLSETGDHAMDVFGSRWQGYTEKIVKNWRAVISPTDTVIIPGDISWGMTLEEARADFALLDALPGHKLLGKGNHDFWWTTATKIERFFSENCFPRFPFFIITRLSWKILSSAGRADGFWTRSNS